MLTLLLASSLLLEYDFITFLDIICNSFRVGYFKRIIHESFVWVFIVFLIFWSFWHLAVRFNWNCSMKLHLVRNILLWNILITFENRYNWIIWCSNRLFTSPFVNMFPFLWLSSCSHENISHLRDLVHFCLRLTERVQR